MTDHAVSKNAQSVLMTRDGAVATLTLNRPAALNALDLEMMDALVTQVASVAEDSTVRVVVLQGAGKHFMAGGDLKTFAARLDGDPRDRQSDFQQIVDRLHAAIEHVQRMPQPVICALRGAVAGFGLSLAAACDLAVAADDAYFASAYRQIGLTPDGGGTWALPRIVGLRKALEIYLLSERFDAHEAHRIGLVNKVVDGAALDATVRAIASSIATGPSLALSSVKRLLRESSGRTLSEQLHAEAESFGRCAATDDFAEGIRAFLAKRPPRFS